MNDEPRVHEFRWSVWHRRIGWMAVGVIWALLPWETIVDRAGDALWWLIDFTGIFGS